MESVRRDVVLREFECVRERERRRRIQVSERDGKVYMNISILWFMRVIHVKIKAKKSKERKEQ